MLGLLPNPSPFYGKPYIRHCVCLSLIYRQQKYSLFWTNINLQPTNLESLGIPKYETTVALCSISTPNILSLFGQNEFVKDSAQEPPKYGALGNPRGDPLMGNQVSAPVWLWSIYLHWIYSFFLAWINLQKNSAQGTHKYGGSPILQMEFSPNKTRKWVLFGLTLYLSLQVWSGLRIRFL